MGLRERKKEQLRADLTAAAITLFIERGYDETKIEDIAVAADVSPRTFFRYFSAKEDVVLEVLHTGVVDLHDQLAHRPAAEPLPQALQAAVHHWIDGGNRTPAGLLLVASLLRGNPVLRARVEDGRRRAEPAMVEIVARRMGADPAVDPYPRVIVSLVLSMVWCAIERWADDGGTGSLGDYVDTGFDLLVGGMPTDSAHTDRARRTARLSVVTPSTP